MFDRRVSFISLSVLASGFGAAAALGGKRGAISFFFVLSVGSRNPRFIVTKWK